MKTNASGTIVIRDHYLGVSDETVDAFTELLYTLGVDPASVGVTGSRTRQGAKQDELREHAA